MSIISSNQPRIHDGIQKLIHESCVLSPIPLEVHDVGTIFPAVLMAIYSVLFPLSNSFLDILVFHEGIGLGVEPERRRSSGDIVESRRSGGVMTHRKRVKGIEIRVEDRFHQDLTSAVFGEEREGKAVGNACVPRIRNVAMELSDCNMSKRAHKALFQIYHWWTGGCGECGVLLS